LRIKNSGCSGELREEEFRKLKESQQAKFKIRCQKASSKHLKMFKIEAFLGTILEKTEKVSLCSLVEISQRRH